MEVLEAHDLTKSLRGCRSVDQRHHHTGSRHIERPTAKARTGIVHHASSTWARAVRSARRGIWWPRARSSVLPCHSAFSLASSTRFFLARILGRSIAGS
jgi:hypothetical protein